MDRFLKGVRVFIPALCFAITIHAQAQTTSSSQSGSVTTADADLLPASSRLINEKERNAPVDYGYGPGITRKPSAGTALRAAATLAPSPTCAIPPGGENAHVQGFFGPAITWPLIGIHLVLLPDGRVMSYGSDARGMQGAQFSYDVWDPALGTDANSHLVLPNTTDTDIFCSGQTLIPTTGELLITGGDRIVDKVRNYSNELTELFDPGTNTLQPNGGMVYARWYPTLVAMPNDDVLILGGRQDPTTPVLVPEVFNKTTGWRTLPNAANAWAFGGRAKDWFYPKAYVAPTGNVFVLANDGAMFSVTTGGLGSIKRYPQITLAGDYALPTVMYAPAHVLSLRANSQAIVVDISKTPPLATTTSNIDQARFWSSATVMADGEVLVSGGSSVTNQLTNVAYTAQIWNPNTGAWTTGAAATKARLYHSNALLLPDGSVLTGAGGAPGPFKQLNMEIYYPPYLYNSDGTPADRPVLASAPAFAHLGTTITATLGDANAIERVTMIRTGSATHSFNPDQRFLPLTFTQEGTQLAICLPADANTAIPGYYLLFAFHNGTPSVAKIVHLVV